MKNFIFGLLLIPAFALAQGGNFSIKGVLKGMPDNTELLLKPNDGSSEPLLIFKSKGDQLDASGILKEPGLYQLEVKNAPQKMMLFLDASNIRIEGEFSGMQASKVTGSSAHNDFNAFNAIFNPLFSKLTSFAQQLNQGVKDENGSIRKSYNDLVTEVGAQTEKFIDEHPNSPVSPFLCLVVLQLNEDPNLLSTRLSRLWFNRIRSA
jgi:hypothetical protein